MAERYRLTGLDVDGATIREIAVAAACDPRSVVAELWAQRGLARPVRGMAGHRIRKVLRARGFIPAERGVAA